MNLSTKIHIVGTQKHFIEHPKHMVKLIDKEKSIIYANLFFVLNWTRVLPFAYMYEKA